MTPTRRHRVAFFANKRKGPEKTFNNDIKWIHTTGSDAIEGPPSHQESIATSYMGASVDHICADLFCDEDGALTEGELKSVFEDLLQELCPEGVVFDNLTKYLLLQRAIRLASGILGKIDEQLYEKQLKKVKGKVDVMRLIGDEWDTDGVMAKLDQMTNSETNDYVMKCIEKEIERSKRKKEAKEKVNAGEKEDEEEAVIKGKEKEEEEELMFNGSFEQDDYVVDKSDKSDKSVDAKSLGKNDELSELSFSSFASIDPKKSKKKKKKKNKDKDKDKEKEKRVALGLEEILTFEEDEEEPHMEKRNEEERFSFVKETNNEEQRNRKAWSSEGSFKAPYKKTSEEMSNRSSRTTSGQDEDARWRKGRTVQQDFSFLEEEDSEIPLKQVIANKGDDFSVVIEQEDDSSSRLKKRKAGEQDFSFLEEEDSEIPLKQVIAKKGEQDFSFLEEQDSEIPLKQVIAKKREQNLSVEIDDSSSSLKKRKAGEQDFSFLEEEDSDIPLKQLMAMKGVDDKQEEDKPDPDKTKEKNPPTKNPPKKTRSIGKRRSKRVRQKPEYLKDFRRK